MQPHTTMELLLAPNTVATVVTTLLAIAGAISTWLQRRGRLREAKLLEVVIHGVEKGTLSGGVKHAISELADEAGVERQLQDRVWALVHPDRVGVD